MKYYIPNSKPTSTSSTMLEPYGMFGNTVNKSWKWFWEGTLGSFYPSKAILDTLVVISNLHLGTNLPNNHSPLKFCMNNCLF